MLTHCRTPTLAPMYDSVATTCRPDVGFDYSTRHVCINCGKPRSRRYHMTHPVRPGEQPSPGVCSRTSCLRALRDSHLLASPRQSQLVVHEVHHYYHHTTVEPNRVCSPGPQPPAPFVCTQQPNNKRRLSSIAELPGENLRSPGPGPYADVNCQQQQIANAPTANKYRKPVVLRRLV